MGWRQAVERFDADHIGRSAAGEHAGSGGTVRRCAVALAAVAVLVATLLVVVIARPRASEVGLTDPIECADICVTQGPRGMHGRVMPISDGVVDCRCIHPRTGQVSVPRANSVDGALASDARLNAINQIEDTLRHQHQ